MLLYKDILEREREREGMSGERDRERETVTRMMGRYGRRYAWQPCIWKPHATGAYVAT